MPKNGKKKNGNRKQNAYLENENETEKRMMMMMMITMLMKGIYNKMKSYHKF